MRPTDKEVNDLISNPAFKKIFFFALDQIEAEEDRRPLNLSVYENPSWAFLQADLNGAKRILTKMRALFTVKESQTNG